MKGKNGNIVLIVCQSKPVKLASVVAGQEKSKG